MVQIGKIVKYDDYGRITCPSVLAEMLDLEKGIDEVTWNIEGGKVVLKKVTKIYSGGFDPESEEIADILMKYEEERIDYNEDDELDYDEAQKRAFEQYKRDKEARKAFRDSKKKS